MEEKIREWLKSQEKHDAVLDAATKEFVKVLPLINAKGAISISPD